MRHVNKDHGISRLRNLIFLTNETFVALYHTILFGILIDTHYPNCSYRLKYRMTTAILKSEYLTF